MLLTDTIKMNEISEEKEEGVSDVEKVSVMIEEYVEHNESRKENVELRGGQLGLEVDGGSGAQPPLESLFSLIVLLVILICKSDRTKENIVFHIFISSQFQDLLQREQDSDEGQDVNLQTEQGAGRGGAWLHLFCPEDRGERN